MNSCPLEGYGTFCAGGIHHHHIINRSKLRGNKAARNYCEMQYPEIFLVQICANHNVSRWADTREAAGILIAHKVMLYGEDNVRKIWDGVPWKVPRPELRFDVLYDAAVCNLYGPG